MVLMAGLREVGDALEYTVTRPDPEDTKFDLATTFEARQRNEAVALYRESGGWRRGARFTCTIILDPRKGKFLKPGSM